jgi:hypothetical protein
MTDYAIVAMLYLITGLEFVRHQTYMEQIRDWRRASSFHVLFWPLFFSLDFLAYLWDRLIFVFRAIQAARRKLKNV